MYEVKNDALVLLGSAAMTRSSTSVYGLSQVSNGLIFSAESSFYTDVNATYICNDVNGTIEKLQIDNTTDISRRLLPYHDTQTSLAWIGGKGYYALNGEDNSEVQLYSSFNSSFTQETTVNTAVYGNKIIFDAVEDYFTTNLVYSDGTSVGSKVLFEIKSCNSNFIIYENYAFFVTRTSNGFRPEFYFIDMEDGSYENFYNSGLSSPSNSVLLIGIQKNKLYYLSNLDSEVGRELYYIELPGLFTDLQEYTLTVSNGSGGGVYLAETEVSIKADEPASGYVFDKWIGDVATIADVNASETTIIMPDSDTDISATYSPATNIHEVGNAKQESSDIKEYIYIDQANDKLYIKNNLPFNANVYSLMGEKMSIYRTADCIDLTTLQDGVYVISILIDNEYLNIKYIKN